MENRQDPPWGKGHVIRPTGSAIVLQASPATSGRIRDSAAENGVSDTDLVKMGLALVDILTRVKKEGHRLAVVDIDGNLVQDIAGL
ncbi:MAG: hypothetical protein ACHRXM_00750 [Isosphaerales bacterium]